MSEHAKLTYKDHSVDIPVVIGTEGEIGLDLGAAKLRDKTGMVSLDVAFKHTASTQSAVTFLDNERDSSVPRLRHRGSR